jgi:hypothetical protein
MSKFRTLLVIGENHEEIVKKYSTSLILDEKKVKYKITEAPKLHKQYLQLIELDLKVLKENPDKNINAISEYEELYKLYSDMNDFDFYQTLIDNYETDDEGNVISDENPNAHYELEECYDKQIRINPDNEAPFADPFILKDGTKVYSAKKSEINWDIMHLGKSDIYKSVWEICVDGREPINDDEKVAKEVMSNKKDYFATFMNKQEYVGHCSAFWTYCIATKDNYIECAGRDIDWTNNFYDEYIKPLPDDTLLTIYQIKLID